jgi:hypothetical protein
MKIVIIANGSFFYYLLCFLYTLTEIIQAVCGVNNTFWSFVYSKEYRFPILCYQVTQRDVCGYLDPTLRGTRCSVAMSYSWVANLKFIACLFKMLTVLSMLFTPDCTQGREQVVSILTILYFKRNKWIHSTRNEWRTRNRCAELARGWDQGKRSRTSLPFAEGKEIIFIPQSDLGHSKLQRSHSSTLPSFLLHYLATALRLCNVEWGNYEWLIRSNAGWSGCGWFPCIIWKSTRAKLRRT